MSTSAEGLSEAGSVLPPTPAAPKYTPEDRVAPEDASLLWPDAHLLAEPPPGYQPLEMPAAWEPEPVQAPSPEPWPYAPYAPTSHQAPAPEPPPAPARGPVAGYVISAPHEGTGSVPVQRAAAGRHALRSFRDLRSGPLAGRDFASMREFAVAAVLEAGYAEADVARLFRFAPWQLHAWVDEARGASFGPGESPA
ncbi:hypothetical protein [Microbacterium sp. MM2322]|uniref:hypothetical protein n=1 Tax=Microbacterium sp. MM2322 TaxID=3157631 RepID=UPI0032D56F5F